MVSRCVSSNVVGRWWSMGSYTFWMTLC
jgi:hypothetical protein